MLLNLTFTLICMEGKVQLPLLKDLPSFLANLLTEVSSQAVQKFRKNIRLHNSMFSFKSMGGHIDSKINNGYGLYIYRVNGQNYHKIGSLLPLSKNKPFFMQIYIHDNGNVTNNRIDCFKSDRENIDKEIIDGLSSIILG